MRISDWSSDVCSSDLADAELEDQLKDTITDAFAAAGIPVDDGLYDQFARDLRNDVIGYGPIEDLLNDARVTAVMVNGPHLVSAGPTGQVVVVASGSVSWASRLGGKACVGTYCCWLLAKAES